MKILFLTYYFPPIKSAGVPRNLNIIRHLLPHFQSTFVFTTANNRIFSQELPKNAEALAQIHIRVLPTFDYRTLIHWFSRNRENTHHTEGGKQRPVVRFAIRLLNGFPFNLLFHEGGLLYTLLGVWHGFSLIKKEHITHIYSSYRPYSDHFTAYLLKILFPKLIWIADFRDLHVDPLYQMPFVPSFQHWCNRQILKKATLLTTLSEGMALQLQRYHPHVYVLRNGVEIPQLSPVSQVKPVAKFTISYTGSMFLDERNPKLFLEIIRTLVDEQILTSENFQILYAGKDTAVWLNWVTKYNLGHFFISKGMVTSSEANQIQREAHVNLLLTSAIVGYGGIMTGKFYEYLAAQQPIIVLINGAQDIEFETIMSDLKAGCIVYNDRSHDALKTFILNHFYTFQKTGRIEQTIRVEQLKKMNWVFQVETFMTQIKGLNQL